MDLIIAADRNKFIGGE